MYFASATDTHITSIQIATVDSDEMNFQNLEDEEDSGVTAHVEGSFNLAVCYFVASYHCVNMMFVCYSSFHSNFFLIISPIPGNAKPTCSYTFFSAITTTFSTVITRCVQETLIRRVSCVMHESLGIELNSILLVPFQDSWVRRKRFSPTQIPCSRA